MKLLNRSAWRLIVKAPYVDWVNTLPASVTELEEHLSLSEHQQEGRVYLVDECDDAMPDLGSHWRRIFENELSAWDPYGDYWPETLNMVLFNQWFDVQPQTLVFDAAVEPLMLADVSVD